MKKNLLIAVLLSAASLVFAYNPPYGGENVNNICEPNMLSGYGSASGGPEFTAVPSSITFNPALMGLNQRNIIDLSGTYLFDTAAENSAYSDKGFAFSAGLSIPSKWCVSTVYVNGTFVDFDNMPLGNEVSVHAGVSKDLTEKLIVGTNIYGGFYFGSEFDFTVGLDLGVIYKTGNVAFFKDSRLGIAFLNLGKPLLKDTLRTGFDGTASGTSYPGILTPRVSFAGTLFDVKKIKGGFSADLSFPFFQNAVFDTAFSFRFADVIKVTASWQANVRELVNGAPVDLPSVGVGFSFTLNTSKFSAANADWAKSELEGCVAWKRLYGDIHAISGSALMNLGMPDTSAPEIILWDGEE